MSAPDPKPSPAGLAIGEILGAYGVRGDVRVRPLGGRPGERDPLLAAADRLPAVWLEKDGERTPASVRAVRRADPGLYLLTLEGIGQREEAEALKGCRLVVEETAAPELPEGEFFVHDLVGRAVVTEDGTALGVITGVFPTGANDVYEISGPEGELLFPALRDLVLAVPKAERTITVRLPPGLLEACLTRRKA